MKSGSAIEEQSIIDDESGTVSEGGSERLSQLSSGTVSGISSTPCLTLSLEQSLALRSKLKANS